MTTTTDVAPTWLEVGSSAECDTDDGEVLMHSSPGKVSGLEECKQLCEDVAECQSITYWKSGYCSHYSTPCTKIKSHSKAEVVLRLNAAPEITSTMESSVSTGTSVAPTEPTATAPATTIEVTTSTDVEPTWIELGSQVQCDTSNGEIYMQTSPGKVPSLDECKQLCEDTVECQSITYFKSGFCSHYSTTCTNTKNNGKAVAIWQYVSGRRNLRGFLKLPTAF